MVHLHARMLDGTPSFAVEDSVQSPRVIRAEVGHAVIVNYSTVRCGRARSRHGSSTSLPAAARQWPRRAEHWGR